MAKHRRGPRIPPSMGGVQVNFCKNPACGNFGNPAKEKKQPRGPGAGSRPRKDSYVVRHKGGGIALECLKCGEYLIMKSNLAIHEEKTRFLAGLENNEKKSGCPIESCSNHNVNDFSSTKFYWKCGKTAAGTQRYKCRSCNNVFSTENAWESKSPIERQTVHGFKNFTILNCLVNSVPLRRIRSMLDLPGKSLYAHIHFIWKQCAAFTASRERKLLGMDLGERALAIDRQDYHINWSRTEDKRNIVLHGVGCADFASNYIFAHHLDFDSSLNIKDIEEHALAIKDYENPAAFRQYARVWLLLDYYSSRWVVEKRKRSDSVLARVESTYDEVQTREDVEAYDTPHKSRRLPLVGMQVHAEYTLYGHFLYLKHLLGGAKKLTFYLDQESGIRAACHSAFMQDILDGRCEAFYVRINKDFTINEKRQRLARSEREMEYYVDTRPWLSSLRVGDIRRYYLREKLGSLQSLGPWRDEWLEYPFPSMSEPEKAVCWLTDKRDGSVPLDDLVEMYHAASLHPIDRYFMQLRRMVRALERSIFSASSSRRVWHAYAPYNPKVAIWLLDIFRTHYNYCLSGKDKKTPAMRLGLARGPVQHKDIIYFK